MDKAKLHAIAVSRVLPNPFRNIAKYPILPEKIDALVSSMTETGWWKNIPARPVKGGKVEIAHGHHRLEAYRQKFGPRSKIELVVGELSDAAMLKMMAYENLEEWGSRATTTNEIVRAVVQAYADGRIELPPPPKRTSKNLIRYAPSFLSGDGQTSTSDHPYTVASVAHFLGWSENKVKFSLQQLEQAERELLPEATLEGLSTTQARAVAAEVSKIHRFELHEAKTLRERGKIEKADHVERMAKKKAQNVGELVASKLRSGDIGAKEAPKVARELRYSNPRVPRFNQFVDKLILKMDAIFEEDSPEGERLEALIAEMKYQSDSKPFLRVARSLRLLCTRAEKFARRLERAQKRRRIG